MNPLDYPNGVQDPNNMQAPDQSAGGKTKITPTDMSGEGGKPMHTIPSQMEGSDGQVAYNGQTSGENTSGIPAAQPIEPMMYGDPNNTAVDHKDGFDMPKE